MLHKLAEDISFYLIINNIIDIEDRDTYIYGLELLISTLLISISILILGILIGNFISAVVFLTVHFFIKVLYRGAIMQTTITNAISILYLLI